MAIPTPTPRTPVRRYTNLRVEVHFVGDQPIPASVIAFALFRVADAIHKADLDELAAARLELPDIPSIAHDAAEFRLSKYRAQSFTIDESRRGSLILAGVALASWFILDKTIGETVGEAWKGSEWHKKLQRLLETRLFSKATNVSKQIRTDPTFDPALSMSSSVQPRQTTLVLIVHVHVSVTSEVVKNPFSET